MTLEPRAATLRRRLVTVPAVLALAAVGLASAPLLLPLLALVDLALPRGRRFAGLRLGLFGLVYLACEVAGILGALALWLRFGARDEERFQAGNFRLQWWWAGTLLRAVQRIFAVELEVDLRGDLSRGPLLVFMRHASLADTLLGTRLFSIPHGLRLRYVLKRELLVDPCLDVVGQRLPNVFVRRDGSDSAAEIAAVAELASGLGRGDGVLIYPEGTRFTPAKRRRVLARLAEREPELARRAEALTHTLPPRPGGPLALLAAAPHADVVLCMHTGFEAAASLGQVWSGRLVGRRVRVRCVRVPAASIPKDAGDWLLERWQEVDAFVAEHQEPF